MERKEAIEIVRKLYNESLFLKKDKEAMVTLIPELAESEDERIRKAIYNCVEWFGFDSSFFKDVSQEECIAWLEKQGEQKPAEWSDNDEWCLEQINFLIRNSYSADDKVERLSNWVKSLKERVQPKQEWSEEDKNALKVVTDVFGQYGVHLLNYPAFIHWLKILPNRITFNPYWRPSDEQMDALNYYATTLAYHSEMQKDLRSLWEDLKKLTE